MVTSIFGTGLSFAIGMGMQASVDQFVTPTRNKLADMDRMIAVAEASHMDAIRQGVSVPQTAIDHITRARRYRQGAEGMLNQAEGSYREAGTLLITDPDTAPSYAARGAMQVQAAEQDIKAGKAEAVAGTVALPPPVVAQVSAAAVLPAAFVPTVTPPPVTAPPAPKKEGWSTTTKILVFGGIGTAIALGAVLAFGGKRRAG